MSQHRDLPSIARDINGAVSLNVPEEEERGM